MNKKIIGIIIGLGLAVALIGGVALSGGQPKTPMANELDLTAFKGEKVYVKFWASWCSICLAGMDELDQLAGQDNDFKVITIVAPGINGEQEKADFIQWFKGLEYKNIQVLFDETGELTKAYGIRAYPTSVFIDEAGNLIRTQPGHVSNERIKEIFEGIQ